MAKGELENPRITAAPIVKQYGKRLRLARETARLTQTEAAKAIGISQPTLSRFESGESQPDFKTFYAMGRAYHCKAHTLMPRNQYPGAPMDPVARQEHFWRRNALIQGQDPDEAVVMHSATRAQVMESRQRGEK